MKGFPLSVHKKRFVFVKSTFEDLNSPGELLYLIFTVTMSTTALVLAPLLVVSVISVFVGPVLAKLIRGCSVEDITPEWLENFSPSSYSLMEGLLADEDFKFLSRQPGFDLSLYRKLRKERLHIFRQYLTRLISDFNRLHLAARLLIAKNEEDHSELVSRLVYLKVRFSLAVLQAQMSYIACRVGCRSLAVQALLLRLEEMSSELNLLSLANAASVQL